MSSPQVQPRTRVFARILGPYVTILGSTVVARGSEMRTLVSEFELNSSWSWVTGSFILLIGLVIVALHPYWRGAPAVIVSVLGWMIVLRGLILLAFPNVFRSVADATIGIGPLWIAVSVALAVAGTYLTYIGWRPLSGHPQADAQVSSRNLPHTA